MAYTKTTWVTGDTVTATKLNHAEDGIANAQSTADGAVSSINTLSANGAIGTANLADGAVTTAKLAANSVTSAKIANNSITEDELSDGAVVTSKIEDGAVTNLKIANGAVGEDQLDNDSITESKFQDGCVSARALSSALDATLAKVDGSYELLTSGNTYQLISTVGVENNAPYVFRTTGGSADVGDRMNLKAVVGGTVAWNQVWSTSKIPSSSVIYSSSTYTLNGVTFTKNNDNSISIQTDANGATGYVEIKIGNEITLPEVRNHTHMVRCNGGTATTYYIVYSSTKKAIPDAIFAPNNGGFNMWLAVKSGTIITTPVKVYPQIHDLTVMFGSTIADYAKTLDSATLGSGIAWLKSYGFFTKPYYPYAAAPLQSVKTSAHITYGFNAYNPSTGKAKVVGGMVYQITGAYTALSLDGTSITPDANGYFTPSANGELTVTGGNSTTTCIHLKWDGERDGEYEPYEAHTYALDDVELRGIPKLDASNNLYYDGDEYTPDGTVTRRYGVVDLGTLTWTVNSGRMLSQNLSPQAKNIGTSTVPKAVTPKYTPRKWTEISVANDMTFCVTANQVMIMDSAYSDKDTFKTAMNGVYLVYELATPTTESADAYTELQICSDWGVEEFVDAATRDFDMPCGSNAVYQPNLRSKLEMSPNSPSNGDGDYIVRQTDGLNEYVALSSNSTISGLTTRCPACSTDTNGTFVLKATVSGGAVTYSWVSE